MERMDNRLPAFTKRFRLLQGERTNTEFAEFLGLSRQTVGFYCNGDRLPDVITLRQIARKCNVTTDWLLDLTDISTLDSNQRAICDYTGLNEESIEFLHLFIADKDENGVYPAGYTDDIYNPKRFVNDIFSDKYFDPVIAIVDFCDAINELYKERDDAELIIEEADLRTGFSHRRLVERLSRNKLTGLKIEYAKSLFSKCLDLLVYDHEERAKAVKTKEI